MVIQSLPQNKIVSLPQTIFFSDTDKGRHERSRTVSIYGKHPNLMITGRDQESANLASELFPHARTAAYPDFVLSLEDERWSSGQFAYKTKDDSTLCCLRVDDESALGQAGRQKVLELVGGKAEHYDTTFSHRIEVDSRVEQLRKTLLHFSKFGSVVTDRYHGLIFAVLSRVPTVALSTVDHKLTSAFEWFEEIPYVRFAESVDQVPALLEEVRSIDTQAVNNGWNQKYFDPLASEVKTWLSSGSYRIPIA